MQDPGTWVDSEYVNDWACVSVKVTTSVADGLNTANLLHNHTYIAFMHRSLFILQGVLIHCAAFYPLFDISFNIFTNYIP